MSASLQGPRPPSPYRGDHAHRALAAFNRGRLHARLPGNDPGALHDELRAAEIELGLLEAERAALAPLIATVPTAPDAFVAWFEALREGGPGQGDPLFPWLASEATAGELRWFLHQEVAGEAGFDDLVAFAQLKQPARPKLEMARNYWDEMGQGHEKGMHGGMLEELAGELGLAPRPEDTVTPSLALGNLMLAMALHRSWAYHLIGALGVIELTAPTRVGYVHAALERLGLAPRGRKYFALHATLDVRHSEAWNREVLAPIASLGAPFARALAEGALIRLGAGLRCFERYRRELGLGGDRRPLAHWRPDRSTSHAAVPA